MVKNSSGETGEGDEVKGDGVESDPSVYQEDASNYSKDPISEAEDESEDEAGDYFLSLKRPHFSNAQDFKLSELFCGRNHDIMKNHVPFFNQKFTCVEDKGSSIKYVRQTTRFLLQTQDGMSTQHVPLGFVLTPFPQLMNLDSKPNKVKVVDRGDIKKLMCPKCGALPFQIDNVKTAKNESWTAFRTSRSKNGLQYECGVCRNKVVLEDITGATRDLFF